MSILPSWFVSASCSWDRNDFVTILKFYFHSPPHHPHHSYHPHPPPHHHHSHPLNPHHDNDQRVLYYLDNRRLKYTEDSSCTTIMISVFLVYFHPHHDHDQCVIHNHTRCVFVFTRLAASSLAQWRCFGSINWRSSLKMAFVLFFCFLCDLPEMSFW